MKTSIFNLVCTTLKVKIRGSQIINNCGSRNAKGSKQIRHNRLMSLSLITKYEFGGGGGGLLRQKKKHVYVRQKVMRKRL